MRGKILKEFKEIMLLEQTVNYIGAPMKKSWIQIFLRAVDAINGVETDPVYEPHPKHMRADQIEAIGACKKVSRRCHCRCNRDEHSSARMKRLYTREEYLSITQQLRRACTGISSRRISSSAFRGRQTRFGTPFPS